MAAVGSYTKHGRYQGKTHEGLRSGSGVYTFSNAFFEYEGKWEEGMMQGEGVLRMRDGATYEGQFENGEMTGRGMRKYANGTTYSGEFVQGELHGSGTWISSEGEQYEGHFSHNMREGKGKLTMSDGELYEVRARAARRRRLSPPLTRTPSLLRAASRRTSARARAHRPARPATCTRANGTWAASLGAAG